MQPLYNREGRAVAYIADNETSIYLYDGDPAGWLHQGCVHAYDGRFLGWMMYGWICDPEGYPAFFTDRAQGGPKRPAKQPRPLRGARDFRPQRALRRDRPSRPGMKTTWSALSDESFFAPKPRETAHAESDAAALDAGDAAAESLAPEPGSDAKKASPEGATTATTFERAGSAAPETREDCMEPSLHHAPQFDTLAIEVEGELGFLTLNRPDRLNALSGSMLLELVEAARWFDQRPEVRVVIVRGAGRAFCAGADIKTAAGSGSPSAPPPGAHSTWQERREAGQRGLRMANAIEAMRAVTIAQLHGYAVGGGFLLATSCDLRVAAEDTVFFIPEVELGIPLTWGGVPRLVRELGPALTKELVMTCRRFGAQEAKEARYLNRVVPADRLEAETRALAASVLAMPAVPVVITKDQVNAAADAMVPARSAGLEGDVLLGVSLDERSREARERYAAKTFGKKPAPGSAPTSDG